MVRHQPLNSREAARGSGRPSYHPDRKTYETPKEIEMSESHATGGRAETAQTGTPNTPAAIVANALRVAQARIDKDAAGITDSALLMENIGVLVCEFTIAYLMEMLHRVAPAVAENAAADLADIWDDGGVINELVWEWRDDLAHGRPLDSTDITFKPLIESATNPAGSLWPAVDRVRGDNAPESQVRP